MHYDCIGGPRKDRVVHPRIDAPARWTGFLLSRLSAISGKIPVSSNRQILLVLTGRAIDDPHRQSICLGRKPRFAPRGEQRHEERNHTQERDEQERLDKTQDSGDHVFAAGAQELSCATIRVGLHA